MLAGKSSHRQISPELYLHKLTFLEGDILELLRGKSSELNGKKKKRRGDKTPIFFPYAWSLVSTHKHAPGFS